MKDCHALICLQIELEITPQEHVKYFDVVFVHRQMQHVYLLSVCFVNVCAFFCEDLHNLSMPVQTSKPKCIDARVGVNRIDVDSLVLKHGVQHLNFALGHANHYRIHHEVLELLFLFLVGSAVFLLFIEFQFSAEVQVHFVKAAQVVEKRNVVCFQRTEQVRLLLCQIFKLQ